MSVTLDILKKEIGKKKRKSQAFAWLADMEREAGEVETALARVNGGLTLYTNDVPAMLVRSAILFQNEDYLGCVEECEKVLTADPFCLSAQKRMGDAYDKLGNENSRNNCYRRVHDMDPLDPFWKEEYDNVTDEVAAGAAAGVVLSESDFAMPTDLDLSESSDETFDMPADETSAAAEESADVAEAAPAEEPSPFEKSADAELNLSPFSKPAEPVAEAAPAAETESSSLFEKSSLFGEPDDLPEESAQGGAAEDAASAEEVAEDDPFAALAALLPSSDAGEEAVMDSLQASLESAMAEMANDEPSAPEVFPTDEEAAAEVSGSDVNSAISDMFGFEDDLEPEEPAEPASPFAHLDLPTSLEDETAESNAKNVFSEPAEDKPQSVDSAFESIFGEDELPEEKPQEPAAEVAEDKPQSVDSAFESIFGEDELPEEKPQEASLELPAEEPAGEDFGGSLFEKSASESVFGDDELKQEETAEVVAETAEPVAESFAEPELKVEEPAEVAEDKPQSVDNAFDSIFGEDELPEEKPFALEGNASFMDDDLTAEVAAPAEESVDPAADLDAPAADFSAPAAEPELKVEEPAEDKAQSVSSAFDSIFGDEDDDLPEEKPQDELKAEPEVTETLAEQVSQAETELELPVAEPAEESAEPVKDESLEAEMGGAFASMFGEEDLDLPEAAPSQEDTGAAVEEASLKDVSVESDLDKSFDNLFGADDDLDLPAEKSAEVAAPSEATAETVAPAETNALESEVDGAFKGLFADDDDDFPEEDKPTNKGVDFLMSGDSDDDVSNGLIKDPSAPLGNGEVDIDESLNTRTLAEIYFEQGLFGKALDIYEDLARKAPENEEIANRLMEIEKAYREKFGGEHNG